MRQMHWYFSFSIVAPLLLLSNVTNGMFVQAEDQFPPTKRKEVGTQWKVTGNVTATNSRPLSGVKAYHTQGIYFNLSYSNPLNALANPSVSDFKGNFEIGVKEDSLLVFVTTGFAPLAVVAPEGNAIDVQMETGRTISGTVTLPDGSPLAGASVRPVQWYVPRINKLKSQFNNPRASNDFHAGLPENGKDWAVVTTGDGKFSIANMPTDFRIGLVIEAEGWKESLVFVRPQEDVSPPNFEGQVLVENDFEFPIEPCSVLEFTATDESGTPAKIARVSSHSDGWASNAFDFRRIQSFNKSKAAFSRPAYPNGSFVYIEPADNQRLLTVKMKMPPNDDIETSEEAVVFPTGQMIRGRVVDDETGKPIAGVGITWAPSKLVKEESQTSYLAALKVKTDRNGEFEFAVPDTDATIGVFGDVPGYRSMPSAHAYRENFAGIANEVYARLTTPLQQGEIKQQPPLEYRLRKSYGIEVTVVDPKDQPVSGAVLTWNRRANQQINLNAGGYGRVSYDSTPFTAETNLQGTARIENFYDDDFFLAIAKSEPKAKQNLVGMRGIDYYPLVVQAFSIEGLRQGQATVPLPDDELASNSIPVTIKLLPGANVLGQVVDSNSNPIAGLEVKAESVARRGADFSNAGQSWKTQTRKDGRFRMEGLPPGADLVWSLDPSRVKTNEIKIDGADLVQDQTLNIEQPIVCVDYSTLADELPEIEIRGLSGEAATNAISVYIQDSLNRIPKSKIWFSRSSSDDPVPIYHDRVLAKVIPAIKEIAERQSGTDLERKLLVNSMKTILDTKNQMSSSNAFKLQDYCSERLLKNHAGNKEIQGLLVEMTARTPAMDKTQPWEELAKASPFKDTQAIAAGRIFVLLCSHLNIGQACSMNVVESVFNKQYANIEERAERAIKLTPDLSIESIAAMKKSLRQPNMNMKFAIENPNRMRGAKVVVSRVEKVIKLLKEYEAALNKAEEN